MTQAQLLEQTTGEKQIKTQNLLEQIKVPETAFTIVGNKQEGYMVTLGKYKLTPLQKTIKQCQLLIDKRDYSLLFAMIGVALEEFKNQELKTINDTYANKPLEGQYTISTDQLNNPERIQHNIDPLQNNY